MFDFIANYWHYLLIPLDISMALVASFHAVMFRRETRAVISWVGFVWLVPILGPLLYYGFGINRIRRKAARLRHFQFPSEFPTSGAVCKQEEFFSLLGEKSGHLRTLRNLVAKISERPLLSGNSIEPLYNGDIAYPAMIESIDKAEVSVTLCSYIFNNDTEGRKFVRALEKAAERGVEVRVLIDDVGLRYSRPTIWKAFTSEKVKRARFLPNHFPRLIHYSNLRNHRKILVVDGKVGFTGGMNIQDYKKDEENLYLADLHFRLEGPVVRDLQEVFALDWLFTTGESLESKKWFPTLKEGGKALARGIADGPDEDFEKMRQTFFGALNLAQNSVLILTPYFLPDPSLIMALNTTSMRGVEVNIILPEENNLKVVHWASRAQWWQVLEKGCKIWLSPPPFSHSKVMIVDELWTTFGSANWDPRSLRLNFEFNVECYDSELASDLSEWGQKIIDSSRQVTLEEVDNRPYHIRLRDGIARLASPYL